MQQGPALALQKGTSGRDILIIPSGGRLHNLPKGFALIDFVLTIAFEHHELFRLAGARVQSLALGRRTPPTVVGRDEQHWTGRYPVSHPLRAEAQCIVDAFKRACLDLRPVVASGPA